MLPIVASLLAMYVMTCLAVVTLRLIVLVELVVEAKLPGFWFVLVLIRVTVGFLTITCFPGHLPGF